MQKPRTSGKAICATPQGRKTRLEGLTGQTTQRLSGTFTTLGSLGASWGVRCTGEAGSCPLTAWPGRWRCNHGHSAGDRVSTEARRQPENRTKEKHSKWRRKVLGGIMGEHRVWNPRILRLQGLPINSSRALGTLNAIGTSGQSLGIFEV